MKGKLIILEGPEASGKSTLARHLVLNHGFSYWHLTWTEMLNLAMRDYQLDAIKNIRQNLEWGRDFVLDRYWPSEIVYATVFRSSNHSDVSEMYRMAEQCGALYVYCNPSDREQRFLTHRAAKNFGIEEFRKVCKEYDKWWQRFTSVPANQVAEYDVSRYDGGEADIDRLTNDMIEYMDAGNLVIEDADDSEQS